MKTILPILTLLIFNSLNAQPPKDLNIDHMQRGYIYAASKIKDPNAPGGYASSENYPHKVPPSIKIKDPGLILWLDDKHPAKFEGYNGHHLYLINNTGATVELSASDSRLNILAEVYIDEKWQPIEYYPSSWCGNSYHNLAIKTGYYWIFQVPKYAGAIQTRLRYKLTLEKDKYITSNTIDASINWKQLNIMEGHIPNGFMDPYND
jgi:hypothetical protein